MTTELLERRLEALSLAVPDAYRVTDLVLRTRRRRQVAAIPRLSLSAAAALVVALLVAYFVPAADVAIAQVPLAGDLLREAGLVGAHDRITWVDAESDSAGHRVSLKGAYADSTRTVFLMHVDPPAARPEGLMTRLTDQFGRSYRMQSSISDASSGDVILEFEGLAWPDTLTGARATVHIEALLLDDETLVRGHWDLTATLSVDDQRSLPAPAAGATGNVRYTFTNAGYTPATVVVDIVVAGASPQDLERIIPDGSKGTSVFEIAMTDPHGTLITGSYGITDDPAGARVHFVAYRVGGGGDYTLRVSYAGEGSFERVIKIP